MFLTNIKIIFIAVFTLLALSSLPQILAVPIEVPVQFVEVVAESAPLSLLDLENANEAAIADNVDSSDYQRTARGLGLLSGKFGGGFGGLGHGLGGLKGFGGGLGGFGGHGFGGGLGGFGSLKGLFGKKW